MKKIILSVLLVIVYEIALCQVGIFETYQDYVANKVIEYHQYHTTHYYSQLRLFRILFIDENNKKIKVKVDKRVMWGYRRGNGDGSIVRIDKKNTPNVVIHIGKIVLYGNYLTEFGNTQFDGNRIVMKVHDKSFTMKRLFFKLKISDSLNGEMMNLSKKNIKKLVAKDKVVLLKLKQTGIGTQNLINFIMDYNQD